MDNPLNFALQMELEGKEYYEERAQAAVSGPVQQIFTALAKDETRHYQTILQMKESGRYDYISSNALSGVQSVFADQEMAQELQKDTDHLAAYDHAIRMEEKSIDLYYELAAEASHREERELFTKLAKEEETHREVLWKLKELTRRPEQWYPYLDLGN